MMGHQNTSQPKSDTDQSNKTSLPVVEQHGFTQRANHGHVPPREPAEKGVQNNKERETTYVPAHYFHKQSTEPM